MVVNIFNIITISFSTIDTYRLHITQLSQGKKRNCKCLMKIDTLSIRALRLYTYRFVINLHLRKFLSTYLIVKVEEGWVNLYEIKVIYNIYESKLLFKVDCIRYPLLHLYWNIPELQTTKTQKLLEYSKINIFMIFFKFYFNLFCRKNNNGIFHKRKLERGYKNYRE